MKNALKSSFDALRFRLFLGLLVVFGSFAFAQDRYTSSELDTLVATIALYPDPLLVHVLDASVHVEDIPRAAAFANAHRKMKGDDLAYAIERADLEYDESVIALIPFPDVLSKMSKYATWTKQLGEAVDMQKADVMDAVQRMRKVANKNGYLKSDDKVAVTVDENVSIQPVRDEYVYVPEYDPRVVYYVVADDYVGLRYVNGAWIGAGLVYWGWDPFVYDWVHRRPHYRYPHRHIPPRRAARPPRPRFDNPPPPRASNPPANFRHSAPPPPRANSSWDKRPVPPPSPRSNATWEQRPSASAPAPSSNMRKAAPPPPPQASSSDDDNRDSRRAERQHGRHNPPPPPSRRGDHGRR